MSPSALPSHATGAGLPALGLGGLGLAAAGAWMGGTIPAEALLFSFVLLAGIVIGSLGLLAIGHLMKEMNKIIEETFPAKRTAQPVCPTSDSDTFARLLACKYGKLRRAAPLLLA